MIWLLRIRTLDLRQWLPSQTILQCKRRWYYSLRKRKVGYPTQLNISSRDIKPLLACQNWTKTAKQQKMRQLPGLMPLITMMRQASTRQARPKGRILRCWGQVSVKRGLVTHSWARTWPTKLSFLRLRLNWILYKYYLRRESLPKQSAPLHP